MSEMDRQKTLAVLNSGVSIMLAWQPMMLIPGAPNRSTFSVGRMGTIGWRHSNGEMYVSKH